MRNVINSSMPIFMRTLDSQVNKNLVYFDDAEKDLNIQMYIENKRIFEVLSKEEWLTTKEFFEGFVMEE